MNTRLQVEHPVTEMVTGVDLVEQQIRVAAGERLSLTQDDIVLRGHAVEARVYAEDPERGFLPTGGDIDLWESCDEPAHGVRTDSGVESGSTIGSTYDPMLAKVIAWGPSREEALGRLDAALARTVCLGITTNITFLRAVIADPDVRAGRLDTGLLARIDAESTPDLTPALVAVAAAAATPALVNSPWSGPWRISGPAPTTLDLTVVGRTHVVEVLPAGDGVEVVVDGAIRRVRPASIAGARAAQRFALTMDDETANATVMRSGSGYWVHLQQTGARFIAVSHLRDRRLRGAQGDGHGGGAWTARSPMPGAIVFVAAPGQQVATGEAVVTVEAMKMEHTLRSPGPGVITRVDVSVGQQVRLDEDLVVVEIEVAE
jgi:acetyl-CoA/propionyl-CoA carboxylase biotin carboxyl carrier protein